MRGIHHVYLETDGMANFRACAEKCAVSDDTLIYRSCFWQPNEEAIMSKSTQINTAPTLRQFATYLAEGELVVTSKLGTSTVSRVKFRQLEYPAGVGEGEAFIRQRVMTEFPVAETMLGPMFEICICDQARAVSSLLGA